MTPAQTVAVLGASPKPERYSHKALLLLAEMGHKALPVRPGCKEIAGHACYDSLAAIDEEIDTLSVYVGPQHSAKLAAEIIAAKPGRIIFNPGAENSDLARQAEAAGIAVQNACTLLLLKTRQF